jgi:hypothetical protein
MAIRIVNPFIRVKFLMNEELENECLEFLDDDDKEYAAFSKVNKDNHCGIAKAKFDGESVNALIYGISKIIIIAAIGWHKIEGYNQNSRIYYPTWEDLAEIGIDDLMFVSAIFDYTDEYRIIQSRDEIIPVSYEIAKQIERGVRNRFPDHVFKAGRQLYYHNYGVEPDWEPNYYFKEISEIQYNVDDREFLDAVRSLGEGCTIYDIAKHCEWDRRKAAKLGDKLEKRGTIRTVKSERNHRRVRLVYLNRDML